MSVGPEKHSVTLNGHRTSISLEPEFWVALREIAKLNNQPINALVSQIDTSRSRETGLASAIRVFILKQYQARSDSLI